jgi:hypothetical protein
MALLELLRAQSRVRQALLVAAAAGTAYAAYRKIVPAKKTKEEEELKARSARNTCALQAHRASLSFAHRAARRGKKNPTKRMRGSRACMHARHRASTDAAIEMTRTRCAH